MHADLVCDAPCEPRPTQTARPARRHPSAHCDRIRPRKVEAVLFVNAALTFIVRPDERQGRRARSKGDDRDAFQIVSLGEALRRDHDHAQIHLNSKSIADSKSRAACHLISSYVEAGRQFKIVMLAQLKLADLNASPHFDLMYI
jgi:hypothetical protein